MDVLGMSPANTLANSTFDILKMDSVEDPLIDVNHISTMDFEESYFASAIGFVNESIKNYTDCKIKLYHAISEAGSETVVLESFSDFFSSVKDIIEKFLKFIKSLFQRFLTSIASLINSDKYLNSHKKDLDNFKSTDEFKIMGYNYTFNDGIPSPNTGLQFSTNSLFADLMPGPGNDLTLDAVKQAIDNMNLDKVYDDFRKEVINADGPIDASDFAEELFRVFRNDELDTEEITADPSYVRQAKTRYFDYKKTKSAVERTQKAIEKEYKRIEDQVKEIVNKNGGLTVSAFVSRFPDSTVIKSVNGENDVSKSTTLLSGEFMTKVDIYIKAKTDMIQEYSNIHAIAFGAKLDALKDCYRQDRATLYTALSRIQRTDNARKEA